MKINKFLVMAAMALGLGVFAACSNDDEPTGSETNDAKAYMAVTLSMPTRIETRANPDGQDNQDPSSNHVGKWAGKDKIEKISIYIVGDNAIEKEENLDFTNYYNEPTAATDGSNTVVLTPKKGIKVKTLIEQSVKVFVVVNDINEKAKEILASANASNFEQKFKGIIILSTEEEAVAQSNITPDKTAAGKIAKKNNTDSETILMTCLEPSSSITLKKGITEQQAIAGQNQAKVNVERAVARAMVSSSSDSYTIKAITKVGNIDAGNELGKISEIKWVVAQGERQEFLSKKAGENPQENTWQTPGSGFVPTSSTYHTDAVKWYDYAGLWEDYAGNNTINGTKVATMAEYSSNPLSNITGDLQKSLSGKFLLPNTHKYGDRENSGYKKGNTPYVLIRAKFVPNAEAFADKDVTLEASDPDYNNPDVCDPVSHKVLSYKEGKPFFVGTNGQFYMSANTARDAKCGGVKGMLSNKYVNNKVLYYAWLNPDQNDSKKWLNSPIVRNNIYHIQISGFKSIGVNWNPLVPKPDPNKPENPNNPDPNPNEPGNDPENPIKPEDPLSNDDTYMSVKITTLPWIIHSYNIELEI